MKTLFPVLILFLLSILSCQQELNNKGAIDNLPPSQIKFLSKLKSTEDAIKLAGFSPAEKNKIITTLDNYVVDSIRQFKNWHFKVETIKGTTLAGAPSYSVDISSPPSSSKKPAEDINFIFTIPKNSSEPNLIELEKTASKLTPGDIIEMDGVIFMTDQAMEIVTLTDYFDPSKPKKLFLIPIKMNIIKSK